MSRHSRRASSLDLSEASTGDCIEVAPAPHSSTPTPRASPNLEMNSNRSSIGASSLHSTPPTSLEGDVSSELDASKDETPFAAEATAEPQSARRSVRARPSIDTYNDKVKAGTAVHTRTAYLKNTDGSPVSRSVSGATLVNPTTDESGFDASEKDWSFLGASKEPGSAEKDRVGRRKSTRRGQLETAASSLTGAFSTATSALGKRTRDVMGSAKLGLKSRFADSNQNTSNDPETTMSRMFPNLNSSLGLDKAKGKGKIRDQEEEEEEEETGPKPTGVARQKKYLKQGLYVGQSRNFDPRLSESANKKKIATKGAPKENTALPLPMFTGEKILQQDRDFLLPFDVLCPLPFVQAPKDWRKLTSSMWNGSIP
jgi:histone-lysine N-methyltransferase ASH1L